MPMKYLAANYALTPLGNEPMTKTKSTTAKRGPGRPPIEDPLDARVVVRLHRVDDAALNVAAMVAGVSKAAYIRRYALAAATAHTETA